MSPRERIELASYRWLCVALALVDTVTGVYLTFTPTEVFMLSPIWSGVLGITGTLAPIGVLFLTVSVGAWVGFCGVPNIARACFVLALFPWGAIVGSFIFAAFTFSGLGTMTATLAALALALHLACAGHFPATYR